LVNILHTSDWHLGKKLYRYSRVEEQKYFLKWLTTELKKNNIHILIIAGDIFDVPSPPNDAHRLYYDFLEVAQKNCEHIIILSGNHDSGDFLKATSPILEDKNIHIFDKLQSKREDNYLQVEVQNKKLTFCALPYFRNVELHRYYSEQFPELDKDEEWKLKVLEDLFYNSPKSDFKIAISHHAFGDYSATGSEHTLSLSGLEKLKTDIFKDYDYVALGHIHQNQKIKGPCPIYYSGSPIPLRFSETSKKYYNLLKAENELSVEKIEIPVFRKIIQIKTDSNNYLTDIKRKLETLNEELTPYIEIKIIMHDSITGMAETIKSLCEQYQCELLNIIALLANIEKEDDWKQIKIHELSHEEILDQFYQEKFPDKEIPKHLKRKFKLILDEINHGEES
jgi:exonuclease SbcD